MCSSLLKCPVSVYEGAIMCLSGHLVMSIWAVSRLGVVTNRATMKTVCICWCFGPAFLLDVSKTLQGNCQVLGYVMSDIGR